MIIILANIFQLVGAILLVYMVIVRSVEDYRKMIVIITPVKGEIPAKLKELYIETWFFRVGLIFVTIGYGLALFNIDVAYLSKLNGIIKIIVLLLLIFFLLIIGLILVRKCSDNEFKKKAKPYNPEDSNYKPQLGEIWFNDKNE
ncbi:hypothetical protein J5Y03_12235 [Bacillus sp. RG28]|uniref:Uncharacterized protein n=1 Tax=Gottfriedia endophytica TaxID=2820819 RepID=A0A940NQJ1_9BACI|nr:hypothetical protein [Gottfriedia endophytica]MBP0725940.1 hypothetical protein [Gottfriedia endophytica]